MPVHTIASNAGVEGSVVVGKLLEQDDQILDMMMFSVICISRCRISFEVAKLGRVGNVLKWVISNVFTF